MPTDLSLFDRILYFQTQKYLDSHLRIRKSVYPNKSKSVVQLTSYHLSSDETFLLSNMLLIPRKFPQKKLFVLFNRQLDNFQNKRRTKFVLKRQKSFMVQIHLKEISLKMRTWFSTITSQIPILSSLPKAKLRQMSFWTLLNILLRWIFPIWLMQSILSRLQELIGNNFKVFGLSWIFLTNIAIIKNKHNECLFHALFCKILICI